MKKILLSGLVVLGIVGAVVGATTAYFSDIETVAGNTFAAGKLDLEIGEGLPMPFSLSGVVPGETGEGVVTLTNTAGSIDGELSIQIQNFLQYENDLTEPELNPGYGTSDYPAGPNAGELNFFLGTGIYVDVNQNATFDSGDYQLTYNGQVKAHPGFWGGGFNYSSVSNNLVSWDNIMTLTAGQSVDLIIMWRFSPDNTPNYSPNMAMTDSMTFDVVARLDQLP